jgi:vancomycin permeability regulator SanA
MNPTNQEISNYMFLEDCPIVADVTIVLGQTIWQRPLEKAIDVYTNGLCNTFIFTGGFNHKLNDVEALCMANEWKRLGYADKSKYLVESRSSNTMENMIHSREILESHGLLDIIKNVNLITINFHMRRAVETFKYVFANKSIHLGIINYPSIYCDPNAWYQNEKGYELVTSEFKKIVKYLDRPDSLIP